MMFDLLIKAGILSGQFCKHNPLPQMSTGSCRVARLTGLEPVPHRDPQGAKKGGQVQRVGVLRFGVGVLEFATFIIPPP